MTSVGWLNSVLHGTCGLLVEVQALWCVTKCTLLSSIILDLIWEKILGKVDEKEQRPVWVSTNVFAFCNVRVAGRVLNFGTNAVRKSPSLGQAMAFIVLETSSPLSRRLSQMHSGTCYGGYPRAIPFPKACLFGYSTWIPCPCIHSIAEIPVSY